MVGRHERGPAIPAHISRRRPARAPRWTGGSHEPPRPVRPVPARFHSHNAMVSAVAETSGSGWEAAQEVHEGAAHGRLLPSLQEWPTAGLLNWLPAAISGLVGGYGSTWPAPTSSGRWRPPTMGPLRPCQQRGTSADGTRSIRTGREAEPGSASRLWSSVPAHADARGVDHGQQHALIVLVRLGAVVA